MRSSSTWRSTRACAATFAASATVPSPATRPSNATCAHTQVGQAGDGQGRVSGNRCLHFPPNTSGGGALSPPLLKRRACRGLRGAGQRGRFLSCPTLGTFGSQSLCAQQRGYSLEMQAPGSHLQKLPFSGYRCDPRLNIVSKYSPGILMQVDPRRILRKTCLLGLCLCLSPSHCWPTPHTDTLCTHTVGTWQKWSCLFHNNRSTCSILGP